MKNASFQHAATHFSLYYCILSPAKQARSNLNDDFAYLYQKSAHLCTTWRILFSDKMSIGLVYTFSAVTSVSKHALAFLTLDPAEMYKNL